MMVLFLDVNNKNINLYGDDGIVKIPFQNAGQLYDYVEDNNILYITNAVQTNSVEVINMIKSMGVSVQEASPIDQNVRYLYSPSEGTIYINEFLKFEGNFDIKLIDEAMNQTIQTNQLLQQLIKNKKIEVIGEVKKRKLMIDKKDHVQKLLERQDKIEQGYSDMIVKDSVDHIKEHGIQDSDHDGATEINILSGGAVADAGGMSSMSELMNEIEGI